MKTTKTNPENTKGVTSGSVFKKALIVSFSVAIGGAFLTVLIFILVYIFQVHGEAMKLAIKEKSTSDLVIYVVSWVILVFISTLASLQIREIIRQRAGDILRKRANYIAIMIALVLLIFLFKQPYLEELFGGKDTAFWLKSILFSGGVGLGWVVWYLRQLEKYGEFFNVFLFTSVAGFCWYARLTAPEEIQLTAVAFLLGSLFRVAKDYLDLADETENQKKPT